MIVDTLDVTAAQFEAATGWAIKPEGACKEEVCVPLGGPGESGAFDLLATAQQLRMGVVTDSDEGRWAVGPASLGDRALTTATAPELVLQQLDGTEFRLSSLRGQKVVVVSWAPY